MANNGGSASKIPASSKDQDDQRRAAKARRRKTGRFSSATNLFDEIAADRQTQGELDRAENDLVLVQTAMTCLCVAQVTKNTRIEQGILVWMNAWLNMNPGRTRVQDAFRTAKLKLGLRTLSSAERKQVIEGMCRARQALQETIAAERALVSA